MRKGLKKILTAIFCGLMAALMIFCIGCGPEKVGPGNPDKPKLPTNEFEDDIGGGEEFVDNTPEDTGTLVNHYFEAETADFIGTSTNGTSSLGGKCIAKSHFFDLSFGGNIMIRNITSTSNKYIFQFKSDKAVKVKMEIAVASAYTSTWEARNLSAMFDIVVNDRQITEDVVVPAGNKDQIRGGNNFTCIQNVEIPVSLKEGDNLIIFNILAGVCNLDYINLKTSANITEYTEHHWEDPDTKITIKNLPTADKQGDIVFSCSKHGSTTSSFKLPELKDGSGYEVTEAGSVKTYSFTLHGKTYSFSDDGTYSVPDGVEVVEPEFVLEPEGEEAVDPDAPELPALNINGKDIFAPAKWTTFNGGVGKQPEKINGAMKFTDAARFDFFYAKADNGSYIHLGELPGKYTGGKETVMNKVHSWSLEMSARYNFDMLLFATAGAPAEYGQGMNASVYLTIEKNKILVKNLCYNQESTEVIAEGTIPAALPFGDDKQKFTLTMNVNRVDGNNLQFSLEINGTKIDLTATGKAKLATVTDGVVNLKVVTAGSYGQRMCVIPRYQNNVVRIYNVTTPETAAA